MAVYLLWASQKIKSHFANFGQVKISDHFADFGQIKIGRHFADFDWWSLCWLWPCQKLTLQQNSFRRNWMPEKLSGLLVHATSIPPWLLKPLKVSTSSELYPEYFWLPIFLDPGIQFFNSPPFPTQSVRLPLVAYPFTAQHLCDLQDTMPYASSHQVFPTQPLLGK